MSIERVCVVVGTVGAGILGLSAVLLALAPTATAASVEPTAVGVPITMREFGGLSYLLAAVALGTAVSCALAWFRGWPSWRVLPILLLLAALPYGWWLLNLWLDLAAIGPAGGQVPLMWVSSWGVALGAVVVLFGRSVLRDRVLFRYS